MKKLTLFCGSFFIFFTVLAQNQIIEEKGKIVFEKKKHDFGSIKEDGGNVVYSFEFVNKGLAPIKLTYVKASCGCTTPDWTKDAIDPGKKGFVRAVFNPLNRPGTFNKTITIKTDGTPSVDVLSIKGDVIPRIKGPKDFYPAENGNLRLSSLNVYFDKIKHIETKTKNITLYNRGDKPITLKPDEIKLPSHLSLEISNELIKPKDTSVLKFTFDARKQGDWGYTYGSFELITDDDSTANKKIYFGATIEEDFSHLPPDAPLPVVDFSKTTHDFGKIDFKQRVKTSFIISNKGQADLYIRKTKASCGCTATQPQKEILAPNESTSIEVTFYSGERAGDQRKSITVITNDPKNAQKTLWIEAQVNEEN